MMTIQVLTWFGGFADVHPVLAVILMIITGVVVYGAVNSVERIIRAMIWIVRIACRVAMVWGRGWPPAWLDADGDARFAPTPPPSTPTS